MKKLEAPTQEIGTYFSTNVSIVLYTAVNIDSGKLQRILYFKKAYYKI